MSFFDVYGPFEVYLDKDRQIASQVDHFLVLNALKPDGAKVALDTAIGCYVFCIRFHNRMRPWYVGMTTAKAGFKGEAFQQHKVDIYNECLSKQRGTPFMFYMPLCLQEKYQFSKNKAHRREIIWLENTLMGFAYRQNPEISNVRGMYFLKNVEVLGLLGKRRGRPLREAQAIRRALLGRRSA